LTLTRTIPPKVKSVKLTEQQIIQQGLQNPMESMRTLTKNSLYFFIRYFWDCYSQDPFVDNWHIKVLCKELEDVAKSVAKREKKLYDLLINQPPGTTKTAVISIFFPVWCWSNWFWMRFITASHSSSLSLESAEYSRDIIKSEKFRAMFPELDVKQDKDTKSNFRVVKVETPHVGRAASVVNGGGRVSTSLDGRITGFHAHIIIWDDLIDPKRSFSDVEIQNANNYLDHTLSTRKTDKESSVMIGVMQRLSDNDPTAHLLEKKKKNIKHICLPGEIVNYYDQLKPKELEKYYVDGLLDPKRLSWEVLRDLESDLGQYGYDGQVGQHPVRKGGGMFKVDHFQVIPVMVSEVSIVNTIRYWDKAGTDEKELKKGQDACYTVGTKISLLSNGKWLIWDVKRGRWGATERERIVRETAEADGQKVTVWIEQEPGSGGKESAQATIRNLAGYACYAECPTGDKVRRADPYSVQVNNGNILLLKADWNSEFIKEHESFPFGKYKDQVDSAGGGFNKLTAKRIAGPLK